VIDQLVREPDARYGLQRRVRVLARRPSTLVRLVGNLVMLAIRCDPEVPHPCRSLDHVSSAIPHVCKRRLRKIGHEAAQRRKNKTRRSKKRSF
jgi:hypothetical protein